jgi:hypothetical protein
MGEKRGRSRTTMRALRVRGPVQFDAGFIFRGAEMLPAAALFGWLDQQGDDPPGLTIGKSTIPGSITTSRQAAGIYLLHFEGRPLGWHALALTQSRNPVAQVYAAVTDPGEVLIETYVAGVHEDEVLTNTPLLIYVFP